MPDRILRAGLFSSEAWLSLKNNDDRVCWIALFETSDCLGNQPAGPFRLIRIWRPYGIDTPEKVAKVLLELADVGLLISYTQDQKPYIHIPRFGQATRYPGLLYPLHPNSTDEEKQVHARKSPETLRGTQRNSEELRETHDGVGVGVGVGVGENLKKHPRAIAAAVDNLTATLTGRKVKTSGLKKTEPESVEPQSVEPQSVQTNPRWQVPSVDDPEALDRFARAHGIRPEAFDSYQSLQQHCIALVREQNAEKRTRS